MNHNFARAALGLAGLFLVGCEAPAPSSESFSYLRLQSVSRSDAFDAAARAMRERYRIERLDPASGVITSIPEESDEVSSQGRLGDVVGVARTVRKSATTQVTGSDTTAEVWCKVVVEQSETAEQRMFEQERAIDDLPGSTAAERGGATTPEQNSVWRVVDRDKQTERAILRSVAEFLELEDSGLVPGAGRTRVPEAEREAGP